MRPCQANRILVVVLILIGPSLFAQDITRYKGFDVIDKQLYWRNIYTYEGSADSLKKAIVQMLKIKAYTTNVVRNEAGYYGEIVHYKVDCEWYQRKYFNTPRIFWEGEWRGKFIVELKENKYRVTIYALSYELKSIPTFKQQSSFPVKASYSEIVLTRDRNGFRNSELNNLSLMNLSLTDEFDIRNVAVIPLEDW